YVCEMKGYSEDRDDAISGIALLTDRDGDGVYDDRTQFASGLLWPTALFPYEGGLFVGDAPHVYYMKDTDGDGVADRKHIVLTGFGVSNVQGLLNSMRWDLDNRVHLACSSARGVVHRFGQPDLSVNVRGRDLAFDPKTFAFELTSGGAQHGMAFDDWGHKFASSNSNHLMQVLYEDRHAARNRYAIPPPSKASIATDGPQAEVFRISPIEPWRVVRTRLRVAGLVGGPIEGGGRPAGYFTGATGATIYRGDAWPQEHHGVAIVGDVGSNLVHRKRLRRDRLPYTASRIDENSEWIRSADNWFRPSQFACGPDGCLYVIDTYREVIEHPKSLPPVIKKHLDLTAGRNRGRIYRVSAVGLPVRKHPNLAEYKTKALVALLEHPNAWHRETAARLIYEQGDQNAIRHLQRLFWESASPLGRMHAMYAMKGLGKLEDGILEAAIQDAHPQVRRHAVRLVDQRDQAKQFQGQLLQLADDEDYEVRLQVAYACSGIPDSMKRTEALVEILNRHGYDSLTRFAVHSALSRSAMDVWSRLVAKSSLQPQAISFLEQLSRQIVETGNPIEMENAIATLCKIPLDKAMRLGLTVGHFAKAETTALHEDSPRPSPLAKRVAQLVQESRVRAKDETLDVHLRREALRNLRFATVDQRCEAAHALIDPSVPIELQRELFSVLRSDADLRIATAVLQQWQQLTPNTRPLAESLLCSREGYVDILLDAVEEGKLSVGVGLKNRLLTICKPGTAARQRLDRLMASKSERLRESVLENYLVALDLPASEIRGREIFEKHCASCHQVGSVGAGEIGPNLATMNNRGPQAMLLNILDPNREVGPEYENYLLRTHNDEIVSGLVRSETASAVELQRAANDSTVVLRREIAEMRSSGKSIMPEGFEEAISQQDMANLLAFLSQSTN
ncbi:MAG: PVC-type heme-binding CxxCH protein, partial [Planctomycetota bacterium]